MKNFRVGIIGCGTIFPMRAESLRNTKGVRIMKLEEGEKVVAVERLAKENGNGNGGEKKEGIGISRSN